MALSSVFSSRALPSMCRALSEPHHLPHKIIYKQANKKTSILARRYHGALRERWRQVARHGSTLVENGKVEPGTLNRKTV